MPITRTKKIKRKRGHKSRRQHRTRMTGGSSKTPKMVRCSPKPLKNKPYSCFSDGGLRTLRDKWNLDHPNDKFTADDPREIWDNLNARYGEKCDTEMCWVKKAKLESKLMSAFAPKAPQSWKNKPNEWLSSDEFNNVMAQFERAFKNFKFLGPSPIDYDFIEDDGKCVWEDLCKFRLADQIKARKTKFGIVFNLDTHDKGGSHWVSMFIDIPSKMIYYFDSVGEPIPDNIKKFADMVIAQGAELTPKIAFTFDQNYPVEHQYGSTECGMYSMFFIIHMLREKISNDYLKTHILSDKYIEKYRKIYFN